jgi:hypothetical protein
MSYWFDNHPTVNYDPTGENAPVLAIDITRMFKLSELGGNSKFIFYDYQVQDHDRPDTIAHKYYDNSQLDWIIFLANQIHDPYFEWPLNFKQFNDYITQKYGSLSSASATIHHYEQIIITRKEYYSSSDQSTIVIPEKSLVVDQTTYNTLPAASRRAVSYATWEEDLNNSKRNIKILDAQYVPALVRQFGSIFD